jgi:hypothetical protein
MSKTPKKSVQETGARAGEILIGVFPRNNGLLIRVVRSQTKNDVKGGPIKGEFRVLDSGTGTYAKGISAICEISQEFDSVDEFM